jgi:hypothetical protein
MYYRLYVVILYFLHINTIIAKTFKQVAVLGKLKFKVSRNFIETLYLIFIRPLLEYAGEVWDNCTLADSERLEKIQLEAACIVTGLASYARCNFRNHNYKRQLNYI